MIAQGAIRGVGVGPGAPDLMSVRADRLVRAAPVVAWFRRRGRLGHARAIVEGMLAQGVVETPMDYPMTTESAFDAPPYVEALRAFYADCVARLLAFSDAGQDVVVLCEGDPFFYGSFMHLHARLVGRAPVEVVPAITGMSGCWTATGVPVTWGDDTLTVLPGTLPESELAGRMAGTDALVVMKLGRNLPKVRRALAVAGLADRAIYVERGTMSGERVLPLAELPDEPAPYFSMIVVHGRGRRP